jgi:hypothetical protein
VSGGGRIEHLPQGGGLLGSWLDGEFSADSSRLLIRDARFGSTAESEAQFGFSYIREVFFSSSTSSSSSTVLLPPVDPDERFENAWMVPNNGGIIVSKRETPGGPIRYFKTNLQGSGVLDLMQNLPKREQSAVSRVEFFPDGSTAIFSANGDNGAGPNRANLFRIDLTTAAVDTFFPLVSGHFVNFSGFGGLDDGASAWLVADLEVDNEYDLYLSAPGLPQLFGPNLVVSRPVIGEISTNSTLAFGTQVLGATASRTIVLRNTGNDPLENIQFNITGGHAYLYRVLGAPSSIPAGESAVITVQFDVQATGASSAPLTITSNDADSPFTVNLSGTGINDSDNDPGSDSWEQANGFDPNVDGDVLTKDSDGDGDPDIWELFQGTDKNGSGESFGFQQVSADAGAQQLGTQFRRSTLSSATSVVTAVGKWSPDLQNWYYSGETVNGVTVTFEEQPTDMGDYEIVNVTASVTEGDTPQLYYTLELIPVE